MDRQRTNIEDRLVSFAENNKLVVLNTFHKLPKRKHGSQKRNLTKTQFLTILTVVCDLVY